MGVLRDRVVGETVVPCCGKKHRVLLFAGGKVAFPAHDKTELARLRAAWLLGQETDCGCGRVLGQVRDGTLRYLSVFGYAGRVGADTSTARLVRRWYRRHPYRTPSQLDCKFQGTNDEFCETAAYAIAAALRCGPLLAVPIRVVKTYGGDWLIDVDPSTDAPATDLMIRVSPNNRLRVRRGACVSVFLHRDQVYPRGGGVEIDSRGDARLAIDGLVAVAETVVVAARVRRESRRIEQAAVSKCDKATEALGESLSHRWTDKIDATVARLTHTVSGQPGQFNLKLNVFDLDAVSGPVVAGVLRRAMAKIVPILAARAARTGGDECR